jgi:hypothetical protein
MEQRDCCLESGIDESIQVRRQKIDGKGEKRPEAHYAVAVEDDVAVDENVVPLVYSAHGAMVVRPQPHVCQPRNRGNCRRISALDYTRTVSINIRLLVSPLLHFFGSTSNPHTRLRTNRRIDPNA